VDFHVARFCTVNMPCFLCLCEVCRLLYVVQFCLRLVELQIMFWYACSFPDNFISIVYSLRDRYSNLKLYFIPLQMVYYAAMLLDDFSIFAPCHSMATFVVTLLADNFCCLPRCSRGLIMSVFVTADVPFGYKLFL